MNHEILEEFQKLGYPVFAQDCLPIDDDLDLEAVRAGGGVGRDRASHGHRRRVEELVQREHVAQGLGGEVCARHPNLVALELSSFKCGHDAPIYTVVEEIVEHSGTPYFCFKDIDENKPTGSIRIRVETIGYFLKRYREDIVANKKKVIALMSS